MNGRKISIKNTLYPQNSKYLFYFFRMLTVLIKEFFGKLHPLGRTCFYFKDKTEEIEAAIQKSVFQWLICSRTKTGNGKLSVVFLERTMNEYGRFDCNGKIYINVSTPLLSSSCYYRISICQNTLRRGLCHNGLKRETFKRHQYCRHQDHF